MATDLLRAIPALLGLTINALTQIFIFRFIHKIGLLKSIILGFLLGFLGVFAIELYLFYAVKIPLLAFLPESIADLAAYTALGYCYFHFINLGETGRRVRLLREIGESDSGLTYEEILKRYNASEIIKKRLARLLDNKQIIAKDNRYYLGKSSVLLMAKIIVAMKIFVLGKASEFEK